MQIKFVPVILKTSALIPFFVVLPWYYALLAIAVVSLLYQHVVAKVMGLHVVPIHDLVSFMISEDNSRVNFMAPSVYEKLSNEQAKTRMIKLMKMIPKTRYKVVEVLGDLYYEEIPLE